MVGDAMKIPSSFIQYLNPKTSTFNPPNIGYRFYVYGIFPVTLNKILALIFGTDNYNDFTLQGRLLSAFFDLGVVFFVFKTVELLEKKYRFDPKIKYLSAFFYAIAVLPIQLSHFFAVDTFLNFFMFASFYFGLSYYIKGEIKTSLLSGVFFGWALASKISAVFIFPLIAIFLIKRRTNRFLALGLFSLTAYISLRIFHPYYFESSNFFNLAPNQTFVNSIKMLKSFDRKDIWYPPAVQWIKKPPLVFSLFNMAFFGVGIVYFLVVLLGMIKWRGKIINWILLWFWGFFLWQSTGFVKALRYFIFLYPFLAMFAGFGFYTIWKKFNRVGWILVLVPIIIWPLIFSSIYFHKHTRVQASEWMYKSLPAGSLILGEHWDDPLPLAVKKTYGKTFDIKFLPVFDPDTRQKWKVIKNILDSADYYVLSSNRAWGSIPTVPEKYPVASRFYKNLLSENCKKNQEVALLKKLPCYRKIKEFKPFYYRVFEFPSSWIDESFTVYDHPTVIVFKKINQ